VKETASELSLVAQDAPDEPLSGRLRSPTRQ
jgi:hypothetical protein